MDVREYIGYEDISDTLQDVRAPKETTSGATSINCEILLLHRMQKLSTEMSNPKVYTYRDLKHRQFKEEGNVNALLVKAIKEKYSAVCYVHKWPTIQYFGQLWHASTQSSAEGAEVIHCWNSPYSCCLNFAYHNDD